MSFLQSITSLFSPNKPASRQTLSYTHDAFSLPTHSPTLPDRASPSFTYPPPTPNTGDEFAPSLYSSSDRLQSTNRHGSLLPLHGSGSASHPHPPLAKTWARIHAYLAQEYPELGDTLNYGIAPATLAEIELNLGMPLPNAVRESYLVVNGQEAESSAGCAEGLFFGLTLLPLEDVLEEWKLWRDVDDDPATGANEQLREAMHSIPVEFIRREYSCRGWIPLVTDRAGNYIGVDMSPGQAGAAGQVIVFGRDYDTKIVLWRGDGQSGWARWLANFVEDLESGEGFELRNSDPVSDDESEDSVGYESYYFSGAGGGKGGDGGVMGGLRFTGDYKGWNAIEVWADKSYKQWYAAGMIVEDESATQPGPSEPAYTDALTSEPGPSSPRSPQTPSISVTAASLTTPLPASPVPRSPFSSPPPSETAFAPIQPNTSPSQLTPRLEFPPGADAAILSSTSTSSQPAILPSSSSRDVTSAAAEEPLASLPSPIASSSPVTTSTPNTASRVGGDVSDDTKPEDSSTEGRGGTVGSDKAGAPES